MMFKRFEWGGKALGCGLAVVMGAALTAVPAAAEGHLPGEGVTVRPLMSNIVEELGYDVQPITETQIQLAHVTVGSSTSGGSSGSGETSTADLSQQTLGTQHQYDPLGGDRGGHQGPRFGPKRRWESRRRRPA